MWGSGSFATLTTAMWTIGTIGLEAAGRALGAYDAARQRSSHVWEISATTKQDVSAASNADGQHSVAVFRIVDFHRQQLEVGVHASRQLTQQVTDHIREALGPAATAAIQQAGTVVAMLPGDQEKADKAARELVQRFESGPDRVSGRGRTTPPTLTYAIVAFPQLGPPLMPSASVPAPRSDATAAAVSLRSTALWASSACCPTFPGSRLRMRPAGCSGCRST
jgi:hypothetical protein